MRSPPNLNKKSSFPYQTAIPFVTFDSLTKRSKKGVICNDYMQIACKNNANIKNINQG